jgi:uncharacterized peroxidase-related enzyme
MTQAAEMKPMFLPDVQKNPKPSPYADLISSAQASGREYWQIWHLFAFFPETSEHLAKFTQGVMRGPAPLSAAQRELIAAYTSYLNECEFCMKSHAAIAAELLGSDVTVGAVLNDLEGSPLPENEKALLRFLGKVTNNLPAVTAADSEQLRQLGWGDEAIFYTICVTALFNFYNRWISASGVHAVSEEGHRSRAKVVAQHGYSRQ